MEALFKSMQDFDIAIYGRVTEETKIFINRLNLIIGYKDYNVVKSCANLYPNIPFKFTTDVY